MCAECCNDDDNDDYDCDDEVDHYNYDDLEDHDDDCSDEDDVETTVRHLVTEQLLLPLNCLF